MCGARATFIGPITQLRAFLTQGGILRTCCLSEVPENGGLIFLGKKEDNSDTVLAVDLAVEAGAALLTLQRDASDAGLEGQQLKAAGDALAQEILGTALAAQRPHDAVLSEEATDNCRRLSAERVWIIDPLDGTREFSEGRHDWAVHVALWENGDLVTGAVALPRLHLVLADSPSVSGHEARSAAIAGISLEKRGGPLRIAVSRSRPAPIVSAVGELLGAELLPMGSAGYKACAVFRGEADVYLHDGGQYEWDSAAPVAVARGNGFHASRLDGSQLLYNQKDPYLPDLLVCRPELAGTVLSAIATAAGCTA